MKKFLTALMSAFVLLTLVSCATTPTSNLATLTKTQDRMFWVIEGKDANGDPSKVYIQGTIHIGDERLYPLSDNVIEAWNSADRVVGEIATEGWENFVTQLQIRMLSSAQAALEQGKKVTDFLDDDEIAFLNGLLTEEGVAQLNVFEPWVINYSIGGVLYQYAQLNANYAVDVFFINKASEEGKHMDGLDELDTQLDLLSFGTYEEQLAMLKETIHTLDKPDDSVAQINAMYEAYLADDIDTLITVATDTDNSELAQNFTNDLLENRNTVWAQEIADYLAQGGTTFIFAGAAHFGGEDSVFKHLKELKVIR